MNLLFSFSDNPWLIWVIVIAAVVVLACIVIICVVLSKRKNKTAEKQTKAKSAAPAKAERKPAPASSQPVKSEKRAAQPAQAKSAAAAKIEDDDDKKNANKTYHISKRKEDGRWQVKAAGGSKAIKLFNTQAEAINYGKVLADNQDAKIVIHKEDGSFRRLTYKK